MKKNMLKNITLVLLGLLLVPVLSHGQGFGSLVGTVTDNSGSVIVSAKVTATQVGTNLARNVTTDSNGYYVIPTLRPAQYNLSVAAAGFHTFSQKDITLLADQTLSVNVEMKVGGINETVEVRDQPQDLQLESSSISSSTDSQTIVELPLNGLSGPM